MGVVLTSPFNALSHAAGLGLSQGIGFDLSRQFIAFWFSGNPPLQTIFAGPRAQNGLIVPHRQPYRTKNTPVAVLPAGMRKKGKILSGICRNQDPMSDNLRSSWLGVLGDTALPEDANRGSALYPGQGSFAIPGHRRRDHRAASVRQGPSPLSPDGRSGESVGRCPLEIGSRLATFPLQVLAEVFGDVPQPQQTGGNAIDGRFKPGPHQPWKTLRRGHQCGGQGTTERHGDPLEACR
jgi:hypothetical protein